MLDAREGDRWREIATGTTNENGRAEALGPEHLPGGTYRLSFAVGEYYEARGTRTFYPEVVIAFRVEAEQAHYHVPLLLSPFAYSTYRGS